MRGRRYVVSFVGVTLSAVQDLFEIRPVAEKSVTLERCVITPDSSETNQQLAIQIRRLPATVTSGSGGTTPAIVPWDTHDAAAGFAAEANNTTQATTSGTAQHLNPEAFPSQGGFEFYPGEDGPSFYNGEALIVNLPEAPGVACSGFLWLRER